MSEAVRLKPAGRSRPEYLRWLAQDADYPSVRIRTGIGGGRNMRTRQALLWLAEAIRLDTKENSK